MAFEGRKKLKKNIDERFAKKRDVPERFPGKLGAYRGEGRPTIVVEGRPDFVWVRIRGATSEPIQAFNEKVGLHFDLPVLVERDENNPNRWTVVGRDVGQYQDWQGEVYLAPHGRSHSFAGGELTGSDIVWVYKRQFMPLLPRPDVTATLSMHVSPGMYFFDGEYRWWPGSGTSDLTSYRPTGSLSGKFVTVFIEGTTGILQIEEGQEFPSHDPGPDIFQYIPLPDADAGPPIAAVFLTTGTQWIGWSEIFDLRLPATVPAGTGSSIGIYHDGVLVGLATSLDFRGIDTDISFANSQATITDQNSGSFYGFDNGSPLGRLSEIDWGDNLDVSVSGTRVHIDAQAGGGGGSGTATYVRAGEPVSLTTITGAYWQVPDQIFATGSLALFLDGIEQRPMIDFSEQHAASGTYQLTEIMPTGTVHQAIWGVPVNVGGSGGGNGDTALTSAFYASMGSPQAISASSSTKAEMDTEAHDLGGDYDTSNYEWTPPAGLVHIYAQLAWSGLADGDWIGVRLYKNAGLVGRRFMSVSNTSQQEVNISWEDIADGNDVYHVEAFTGNTNTVAAGANASYWFGRWIGTV